MRDMEYMDIYENQWTDIMEYNTLTYTRHIWNTYSKSIARIPGLNLCDMSIVSILLSSTTKSKSPK